MKINLLSHDNGVGLTQDIRIVRSILAPRHEVVFTDLRHGNHNKADVNIFFEILDGKHYDYAKVNLFFPNPEWFWWPKQLSGIDIVLAKTHDAVKIFENISTGYQPKVVYTSFTSEDRYDPDVPRERAYLHAAGQSETKGTQTVFNAWKPEYPRMVFTKLKAYQQYTSHHRNIITCFDRMPLDILKAIQNKCAFHICTSEYEGFGHYIWEAKSCGGIVITTDGAPMKEMVTDGVDGWLVDAPIKRKMNFARCSIVGLSSLQEVIEKTIAMTDTEVEVMRAQSRRRWEDNDAMFRAKLNEIINSL